ncbi:MAG: acyl-CoA dehydrogenase, partial [Gammaproteobacteria bacterium]|nr:acyl-CoA dehydrogenase [Gammaproteobacteria bacterium]
MAIDFTLSAQQRALQQAARGFARTVLTKVRPTIAAFAKPEDRFFATRPFYAEMANNGFVHALVPEAFGGQGLS